jgi:hypothetical protein
MEPFQIARIKNKKWKVQSDLIQSGLFRFSISRSYPTDFSRSSSAPSGFLFSLKAARR